MRSRQLTPTLLQLTRLRFVNAYLVREGDGFTLVDTTVPRGADALLDAAADAGAADPADRSHARARGPRRLARRAPRAARRQRRGLDARGRRAHPCGRGGRGGEAAGILADAEDRARRATPGRRPGREPGGDRGAGAHIGGAAVTSHFTLPFPRATMANWNKELNLGSARELRVLEPTLLAVGDGPAVRDPHDATVRAIERAHRALC
jgi:hypothetical protein